MKFGYREKIAAAAIILALFIVGWYLFYFSPKSDKIAQIEREIRSIQHSIGSITVTPALLDSLKEEIAQLQKAARKNMALSLPQDSMLHVQRVLRDKINEHKLEITGRIKPNTEALFSLVPRDSLEVETGIRPVDIELFLKGKFFDLVAFLESFSDFPFLIRAGEIEMDTGDDIYPDIIVRLKVYVFFG